MSVVDPLNKANSSAITLMIHAKDVDALVKHYKSVFGFEVLENMIDQEGKGYALMSFRDSKFMILEEELDESKYMPSPSTLKGTSAGFYLYVEDVVSYTESLGANGVKVTMPATEMPWGDKCSVVIDIEGHYWMVATHVKEIEMA